jgi:hypothetical protein
LLSLERGAKCVVKVIGLRCKVLIGGVVRCGFGINVPESAVFELVPIDEIASHVLKLLSSEIIYRVKLTCIGRSTIHARFSMAYNRDF